MSDRILEKEFWNTFVQSQEWKYLLKVFKDHKDFLNKQALSSIGSDKPNEAIRYQAKAEDMEKIVDLIEMRINEVGKEG